MSDSLTPLNLQLEKQKDTSIKLVIVSTANGLPSTSPYMNTEFRKYLKQIPGTFLLLKSGESHDKFTNNCTTITKFR